MDLPTLSFHDSLEEKLDEEEEPEEIEIMLNVIPPAYHQYLDVFFKVKAEKLPPHGACDHHIKLEGVQPPVGVIYSLSNQETETLWAYVSENSEKGFIRPSSSSTGEPVLFVKKKDGGLHLCVDYHKLNAVTRKNRYHVPPMNQLLTILTNSTILSKIDLPGAYNLLRIKRGMSTQLPLEPNMVVMIYSYDIMVFSSSEEEHFRHLASVLQRLRDNSLFSKASNCVFHASIVEYLGCVVSSHVLKMDSSKVKQILNWPQPKNIKALQSSLAFPIYIGVPLKITLKKSLLSSPSSKKTLLSSSMRKLLVDLKHSKKLSPLLLSSIISILLYLLL
ncbi:hypothetical protein O181_037626 [Austropuccinia psidii MF-1]|uniref:Reverse transcriptase domain-containing protein n=1 Tax=Austropuccinia psidii MF-1 TaxID=1389203 RepID=A0A9Q3D6K0_9BASI|nr:hypothetical protein [Austropuccinia psidii MF-1]